MKIDNITAVYFSPTGGSKKYVQEITRRINAKHDKLLREIDLTNQKTRQKTFRWGEADLVVIGAPVYYGRLPQLQEALCQNLHGNHTPAVFVVTYGNRDFDDALLELADCCVENGFFGVGAGAFIAPHTFSQKAGAGRPDEEDYKRIDQFADEIKEILKTDGDLGALDLPGNRPYRDFQAMPFHPVGDDTCNQCGLCAELCPTGAITKEHLQRTDAQKCICCFACVKNCPEHSRQIKHPMFAPLISKLEEELLKAGKQAKTFLP